VERRFGSPNRIEAEWCYYSSGPGYSSSGALYIEGNDLTTYSLTVCKADREKNQFHVIHFKNRQLFGLANPMWDGKYLTIVNSGDGYDPNAVLFRTTPVPGKRHLKTIGETTLTDTCDSSRAVVYWPFIVGRQNTPVSKSEAYAVVGPDAECSNRFSYWHYPQGGNPYKSLSHSPSKPSGDSVSIGQ
jgi:hypothetical protein